MNNLLYAGEVLDHEAIAKLKQNDKCHFVTTTERVVRAINRANDITQPMTLFNPCEPTVSGSLVWFKDNPRDWSGFLGCGFMHVKSPQEGDVLPLSCIKTNARQALERLRDRLDRGVL